jgi:hypothetical protein
MYEYDKLEKMWNDVAYVKVLSRILPAASE